MTNDAPGTRSELVTTTCEECDAFVEVINGPGLALLCAHCGHAFYRPQEC